MHTCPIPMSGPSGSEKSSQMCTSVSPLSPVYFHGISSSFHFVSLERGVLSFYNFTGISSMDNLPPQTNAVQFTFLPVLFCPLFPWGLVCCPQSIIDEMRLVLLHILTKFGVKVLKAGCWSFFLDSMVFPSCSSLFHEACSLAVAVP